jgi:hypothetical protein
MTVITVTQKDRFATVFSRPLVKSRAKFHFPTRINHKILKFISRLSVIMVIVSFVGIFALGIQAVELTSALKETNLGIEAATAQNEKLTAEASRLLTPELLFAYAATLDLRAPTQVRYLTVGGEFLAGEITRLAP